MSKEKSLKDVEEEKKRAKKKQQMRDDIGLVVAMVLILLFTGAVVGFKVAEGRVLLVNWFRQQPQESVQKEQLSSVFYAITAWRQVDIYTDRSYR